MGDGLPSEFKSAPAIRELVTMLVMTPGAMLRESKMGSYRLRMKSTDVLYVVIPFLAFSCEGKAVIAMAVVDVAGCCNAATGPVVAGRVGAVEKATFLFHHLLVALRERGQRFYTASPRAKDKF